MRCSGSLVGGAAFAVGGRAAVGVAFAAVLLAAATPFLRVSTMCCRRN